FINMIAYARVRVSSNQTVKQLDAVSGRLGFDLALYTTELISYYDIAYYLVDDSRRQTLLRNHLLFGINQTIWVHRNYRIGLQVSANVEPSSRDTTWIFGGFWEGSRGRGLDDYST